VQGSEQKSSRSSAIVRFIAVAAIVAGVVLAAIVLFGGNSGHKYKLIFETGGQLVPGNLVSVGGQQVGTVDDIKLTDDARAEVSITVDEPLHEGTTATVRATSLSGIANRYVSLAPGPNSAPELDDETVIG
jgi:phospholipid/cholesterol/gamma-HCH transport system substrate-binding protein